MKAELLRHEPIPLPPPEVVITMEYEAARTLLAIMENVGGVGDRRMHVDKISKALRGIDVEYEDKWVADSDDGLTIRGNVE